MLFFLLLVTVVFCGVGVSESSAKPTRGMLLAPGELGPGIGFSYSVELRGKEKTKIEVIVKEGDVDCDLFDVDGKLIIRDAKEGGCKLDITPTETAKYVFLVKNASDSERAKYTTFMQ